MKAAYITVILVLIVLAGIGYYYTTPPIPEITTTTSPLTTTSPTITIITTTPTTTGATTTTIECNCPDGYIQEGDSCNPECLFSTPPCASPTIPCDATITTTTPIVTEGILVMKIKDKLDLTNISAIDLIISKVEVHKTGNDDETESNETFETNETSSAGWITIVDETKSYNLLDLVDAPGEVMGEKTLSAGKYTQIRLYVSEAKLTLENETYDIKVPSKRFYWIHPFYIESGKITTLTLDFDAADSIKETGKNKFILKPTVKIIGEISTTTTTISTSSTTTTMTTTESTTTESTTTLNATTTSSTTSSSTTTSSTTTVS